MKFHALLFFLLLIFFAKAEAQTCTGSLGDPVINETFGAGTATIGPSLKDTTSYTYIVDPCPNDGYYTLAHSVGDCFSQAWHVLTQDHTGDPNGYMMIVNASPSPGLFFTYPVHGLCSGTTYQFGAWILNLILPSQCSGNPKLPNIAFSIETVDGKVLATTTTGSIPATSSPQWNQYSLFFKTPPGVTDVVLKMNNANMDPGTCGNDLAIDDITFRPCGPIVAADFGSTNSNIPANLCVGYTGNFPVSASVDASSYTNVAYQWQFNNGSGWVNIAGATQLAYNIQFANAQLGIYQYRLAVAEAANINSPTCRVLSNELTLNVTGYPTATAGALNSPVCIGDSLKLTAGGGATYLWTGPAGFTSNVQNPVIPVMDQSVAGTYSVTVTSAAGCAATASVMVSVYPPFIANAGTYPSICEGETITLHATGGVKYSWSPARGLSDTTIANPQASPTDTTTYVLTATSQNGCQTKDTVTINVSKKPAAMAGPDKIIFSGQSTQLNGAASGTNISYSWTPVTYLSNPAVLNPVAKPVNDINYILHVTDSCGTAMDTVFVKVYKSIVIPNAFSPNGDGVNDTWNIEALVAFPQCLINVYNRDGQLVYTDTGYTKAWDGKYRQQPLPTGTYYYVIDLKANMPQLSGSITIIR